MGAHSALDGTLPSLIRNKDIKLLNVVFYKLNLIHWHNLFHLFVLYVEIQITSDPFEMQVMAATGAPRYTEVTENNVAFKVLMMATATTATL